MPNCKVGDIAYIIAPYRSDARGHVVTVLRRARSMEILGGQHFSDEGSAGWVCRGSVPDEHGHIKTLLSIGDDCLLPIRDPGEDAVDESKQFHPDTRRTFWRELQTEAERLKAHG